MRALAIVSSVSLLSLIAASHIGCARKSFVREAVGEVNERVETLDQSLEATQQQNREQATRITQVDQKADQAGSAAQSAQNAAKTARSAADAAAARTAAVEASARRLILEVVITDSQGNFSVGGIELPEEMRAKLDGLAAKLKSNPAGNFIEIEGHTDSTGSTESNEQLGLARAESVKRYLYETYQIPLHKINVISYGETKPVAPNTTREGRAQNRRVVIKVLA